MDKISKLLGDSDTDKSKRLKLEMADMKLRIDQIAEVKKKMAKLFEQEKNKPPKED